MTLNDNIVAVVCVCEMSRDNAYRIDTELMLSCWTTLNRRRFLKYASATAAAVGAYAIGCDYVVGRPATVAPGRLAKYELYNHGADYVAVKNDVTLFDSSPDAGKVIQICLTDAGRNPFVLTLEAGSTFAYKDVVPAFEPGAVDCHKIIGYGATIQLASGAPRVFDLHATATGQTFKNIWLEGFDVNCNDVGGRHHVIIGTYVDGKNTRNINIDNLRVRNINAYNIPVDPTTVNHRLGVWFSVAWQNGDATCSLTNIRIEIVVLSGGNAGIAVAAVGDKPSSIFVDDIHFHHCRHSLLSAPTQSFASSNFQIGNTAYGGYGHISDCYGEYSGDDGIEINGLSEALVENCSIRDAYLEGYLATNFTAPPGRSHLEFRDCTSQVISLSTSAYGAGFACHGKNSNPFDELYLVGCRYYNASPNPEKANGIYFIVNSGVQRVVVDNFKHEVVNLAIGSLKKYLGLVIQTIGQVGYANEAILRNVKVQVSGSRTGNSYGLVSGLSVGCSKLTIDGLILDMNVSGMAAGTLNGVRLGVDSNCAMDADVSRVVVYRMTGDPQPQCLVIGGTRTLTIPHQIRIMNCDFSEMPAGSEIEYLPPSNSSKVYYFANTSIGDLISPTL
jgi:hypothetical protein